ncbi:MAG: GGDEF domain-containing protein [Phycisphaerales bacterium]
MTSNLDGSRDEWRVILVGRTGLDQEMRRDAGFELIRARDAMDAIGELSDPIDKSSPKRAVVVVSPDAEPDSDGLGAFIGSLRRIDGLVKVVRVGEPRVGYDANIDHNADAAAMRHVLADPSPSLRIRFQDPEAPASNPSQATSTRTESVGGPMNSDQEISSSVPVSRPESVATKFDPHVDVLRAAEVVPETNASAPGDDAPLVRALLAGRSIIEPALGIARLRAGRDDLVFDVKTGRLTCDDMGWTNGPGAKVLASLSGWLSGWVRLDAQHAELRHAAFTDPLTDAWNRRYFDRFMDAAIEQARLVRRTLTLMVFDIDDFKKYNDTYGHSAGDEILVETVRLLNSVIRPTDRVCRIGGDEFAVIFYEPEGPRDATSSPPESIYGIATRFQKQICGHRFPKLSEEAAGTLTISGGLATFPWDGHNVETLLERADQLSMESKRQGKNALTFGQGADRVCRLID